MPTYAPALQSLIDQASQDLANRLPAATSNIRVVEAGEVVWPDASLGCPQPDMAYAEVLTPGYLVRLEYAGVLYEYHAGKAGDIFYCQNPTPPVPGTPGNT